MQPPIRPKPHAKRLQNAASPTINEPGGEPEAGVIAEWQPGRPITQAKKPAKIKFANSNWIGWRLAGKQRG